MCGLWQHIDGLDVHDFVAVGGEFGEVFAECFGVTGDVDDRFEAEAHDLFIGGGEQAAAWRVDDEHVIGEVCVVVEEFAEDLGRVTGVELNEVTELVVFGVCFCVFDSLFFDIDGDGAVAVASEAEGDGSGAAVQVEDGGVGVHEGFSLLAHDVVEAFGLECIGLEEGVWQDFELECVLGVGDVHDFFEDGGSEDECVFDGGSHAFIGGDLGPVEGVDRFGEVI